MFRPNLTTFHSIAENTEYRSTTEKKNSLLYNIIHTTVKLRMSNAAFVYENNRTC